MMFFARSVLGICCYGVALGFGSGAFSLVALTGIHDFMPFIIEGFSTNFLFSCAVFFWFACDL